VSAGDRRKRREAADAAARAIAEAVRNIECRCGRILEGEAAYAIHTDAGCDHPEAFGQLVRLPDGRFGQRYRHPEITR